MKEIVVISGKGGTGKTSITASLAYLGGKDVVIADCDVDAADMHMLLQPDFNQTEDFFSGLIAEIDPELCTGCGECAEICRFKAIPLVNGQYVVNALNCEGCDYCRRICPTEAITMNSQNIGHWFISNTKAGNQMVHARLGIGAENSGKLVAKVKNEAKRIASETGKEFVIVDGSPGIGCPVVSSLSGASFVVLVTEPTVSGFHDFKRVYQLVKKFNIKAGYMINKSDLNAQVCQDIEDYSTEENIICLSNLPYDETFTEAMVEGLTIVEFGENEIKEILKQSWEKIMEVA
jgi:MinD superfamily P-loop ATPase